MSFYLIKMILIKEMMTNLQIENLHKHMSPMAKVNHLAWFNGPIFQEIYLESTLPLEIPTAYSYRSLWSQLRSCISSIFKIESRGLLIVENDIWQSFEHNFPWGPLIAVGPFAQPSIFLKRALKGISLWCREEPIV